MDSLESIERTLPNGFHDSELVRYTVDFVGREARFELRVDLTDWRERPSEADFRPGVLVARDLVFFAADPPDCLAPERVGRAAWIVDVGSGQPSTAPVPMPPLPASAALHWLYFTDTCSFIRFACGSLEFELTDPAP